MNVYVLDSAFIPIAVIDSFRSLIWTKRYYTCGDFELYLPAERKMLSYLQKDNVIIREDDDIAMIIERAYIQTDTENGDYITVSGRSLESILARRVIMWQTVIDTDDVVQGLKQLVTAHTGNGNPDSYRAFPNFTIDDTLQVLEKLKAQFTGQVLLDAVSSICQRFQIGFKIVLSGTSITMSFYQGSAVDVTFSPEFDNMISSKYVSDASNLANYAIVAGQGEGLSRVTVNVSSATPSPTGLALREMWVDARDISSNNGEIPLDEYAQLLTERGRENLAERDTTQSFEAEIEPQTTFIYKTDYNLGDVVNVINEYGITAHPRIIEIIECWDENGYKMIPTLSVLEV